MADRERSGRSSRRAIHQETKKIRRAGARSWLAGAAAVTAIAVLAVWWIGRSARITSGECDGCNLLLVTIDTLRSDRIGAFGGPADLTPNLDRLAADGLRFTRAYASAPLTLPSHTSILTAVSPPVHGVRTNGLFRLGPALPTLATVLHDHGYRTGAFVGAFVLDARFGLTRGFDVYDDRYGEAHSIDTEGAERRAEDVIAPALAWIEHAVPGTARGAQASDRFFAWIHLYDPHEPYRAPEPYASRHAPYDAEVAYTDAMIGRLVDELNAKGLLNRTLIVVSADHGESLGEHGERTHGVFTYDVTMRVPWFMRLPGRGTRASGRAFDGLARLIDLAPTTLDVLAIGRPPTFEGRSLLPALNGVAAGPATAYVEAMDANITRNWAPLTGIVSGSLKLIDLPVPEMYDLVSDPHEATNVYTRNAGRARVLRSLLKTSMSGMTPTDGGAEKTSLNTDAHRRLQALGYVAASVDPAARTYTEADDPKALIGPANALNDALAAFNRGERETGVQQAEALMRAHPAFATASGVFASMQWRSGDRKGAIATLEALLRRGIADQSVMVVLGGYLQETGDLQKAAGLLEAVVAAHPDYVEAYNSLAVVYSNEGRHADARRALEAVLQLDPTSARAYENLGVDDFRSGDLRAAETHLTRALELDPALAGARNALAAVYMRERRPSDAVAQWKKVLETSPDAWDALYNLATVLYDSGQRDVARSYLERFVREAPQDRYAGDIERLRRLLK
jgi:arylsulfatase A-like enzyme/tetratricopeptide (TPR) repeat protein